MAITNKDYNYFADYTDEIISDTEFNKFEEESKNQPEDADIRLFTKEWLNEQFEKKLDETPGLTPSQIKSMKENYDKFASKTTNLERLRYTSPDRKRMIDLSKYVSAIESREGTIIKTDPYTYRDSDELKNKEKIIRKKTSDVKSLIDDEDSDILLKGTISDYKSVFRSNKLKLENEVNRKRLKDALTSKGVKFDEDASLNALQELAKKKNVEWEKTSPGNIRDIERVLNLISLKTNLTSDDVERKKEYEDKLRRLKRDSKSIAVANNFMDKISEKNSMRRVAKNLNNYEVDLLYQEVQLKPRKISLVENIRKDIQNIKNTKNLSRLKAIEAAVDDQKTRGILNPLQNAEIERQLFDARKAISSVKKEEKNRSVDDLREILKLKNVKVGKKTDAEIKKLAKQQGVSFKHTVAQSPEELIFSVARYKTNTKDQRKEEIKRLKKAYNQDRESVLDKLQNTHQAFSQESFPRAKPAQQVLVTRDDLPVKRLGPKTIYMQVKEYLPDLTRKEYDDLKTDIVKKYLNSLNLNKKDASLLKQAKIIDRSSTGEDASISARDFLNRKALSKLISAKEGIPVIDEEIEKRYKEMKGIPLSSVLGVEEKQSLRDRLEKATNPKLRTKSDREFLYQIASKGKLPVRSVKRGDKVIEYRPDYTAPAYEDTYIIPGVGEEGYFGIKKKELDFKVKPFRIPDVKKYVGRLDDELQLDKSIISMKNIQYQDRMVELEKQELKLLEEREAELLKMMEEMDKK